MLRKAGSDEWVEQVPSEPLPNPFQQFIAAIRAGEADPEHLRTAVRLTQIHRGVVQFRSIRPDNRPQSWLAGLRTTIYAIQRPG